MKQFRLAFHLLFLPLSAAIILSLAGCSLLGSDSGGGGGSGGSGGSVATQNLRELPEVEAQLPASLSAAGSGGSASASVIAMAQGDVTTVSASALPDVKAQGWYDMKDAAGLDFLSEAFLDELREIANEQELDFGVVYDLGVRDFMEADFDLGNLKLAGSDNDLTVYWYAEPTYLETGTSFTFWARIRIVRNGDDWTVTANFEQGGAESGKIYANFATATGESLFLSRFSGSDPESGPYSYEDITQSIPNDDGSLTILSGYSDGSGGWGETRIGWGDDTMGGVIGVGNWGSDSYASQEYYNGDGSLLQQSWGTTAISAGGISWVEGWGFNIISSFEIAPAEVWLFDVWESGTLTQYVSSDNVLDTGTDTQLTSQAYTPYFKAGSSWAEGDAVYNWSESSTYIIVDAPPSTSVWRTKYEIGYQIPARKTIFGGSYYFEDRYPLKHLLPLTGVYDGKSVIREEGTTWNDTWTDADGKEQSWSWTSYSYYIDVDDDGAVDTDDVFMDGVWLSENYVWDFANQREIVVKAPFLTTTGGKLPAYLAFSSQNQTLVDAIETKILSIYDNDLPSLSVSAHEDKLEDLSSLSEFDDVEF